MKTLLNALIHARDPDIMLDAIYRLDRWDLQEWVERQPHITLAAAYEIKERLDSSGENGHMFYDICDDELWYDYNSTYDDDPQGYKSSSHFVTKIVP